MRKQKTAELVINSHSQAEISSRISATIESMLKRSLGSSSVLMPERPAS
jgi:hypothetical protein